MWKFSVNQLQAKAQLFTLQLMYWRPLAYHILVFIIILLDPFGLTTASDKASRDVLNLITSPWYGDEGQKKITVVLIDDSTIRAINEYEKNSKCANAIQNTEDCGVAKEGWPLSYVQQARIFTEIISHNPQSVFIDLLYTHDHSTSESTIKRFVSDVSAYAELTFNLKTGEKSDNIFFAKTKSTQDFIPAILKNNFKFLPVDLNERDNNYYPLYISNTTDSCDEGENCEPSVAAQLYKIYCKNNLDSCDSNQPKEKFKIHQTDVLSLRWGINVPEFNQRLEENKKFCLTDTFETELAEKRKGFLHKLMFSSELLFHQFFAKLKGEFQQRCYYTRTINAAFLLFDDNENMELRQAKKEILESSIVLVGAKIQGAADMHESVVHGQVPGVFIHAMAIDNLITLNKNYIRKAPVIFWDVTIIDLLEVLLLSLVLLLSFGKSIEKQAEKQIELKAAYQKFKNGKKLRHYVAHSFYDFILRVINFRLLQLLILILVGGLLYCYFFAKLEAANWLALGVIIIAFLRQHSFFVKAVSWSVKKIIECLFLLLAVPLTLCHEIFKRRKIWINYFRK